MHGESLAALKAITIRDNGEPLVDVKKVCPDIVIDFEPRRLQSEGGVYVRKTVAHMLKQAKKLLPLGLTFKVRDAWRPLAVQERYYRQALRKLQAEHRNWLLSRVRRELNKWIFPPDSGLTPWHMIGGAIDLTICTLSGRALPMKSEQAPLPQSIQRNRRLLKNVMEHVGFTNYAHEWWHFSYGDTGWALRTGRKQAIYGLISPNHFKRNP